MPHPWPELTGVLDVGSSKLVCVPLVFENGGLGNGGPRWVGLGVRPAEGIKAGEIVDPSAAEAALAAVIADAERSAGAALSRIVVGVGCGRMASHAFTAEVSLDPTVVQASDIARIRRSVRSLAERDARMLLHEDTRYALDGRASAPAPIERFGRRLEADVIAVTADAVPLQRLIAGVGRAGIEIAGIVPSPLAAALAVTSEAERRDGIAVVDMGAGLTSMTSFVGGRLERLETVTIGGRQLTADVASALQLPLASAERIKQECASLASAHAETSDDAVHRLDSGQSVGGRSAATSSIDNATARATVCDILLPRLDTILGHVGDHLDATSVGRAGRGRVVLTGGSSQLPGLATYAARILGCPVRLGRPGAGSFQATAAVPSFAAVAGMAALAGSADVRQLAGRLAAAA